jgi:hypothetical protein
LTSPDGRFPLSLDSRPRRGHARAWPLPARRLRGCASRGFQVSTTAGTALHRTRIVIRWKARPETFAARPETFAARPKSFAARPEPFAARGFSDLRTGFVLRDESSRRERSRAPHESGRAAPEHGAGSPALGTQPPPLEILRSTNWARISEDSEEPDAGTGVTRRHLGAYLDELVFRSNRRHNLAVAFGALLDLGAMRELTTNDTITGASDIPRISCTPKAEADRQAAAAQQAPSAGHDISYFPGGNRTGTPRGMARWASEFRSMSCCSCQVHLRRAHVIPSRLARPASSFGLRVNRVQDTAAPGARSVR